MQARRDLGLGKGRHRTRPHPPQGADVARRHGGVRAARHVHVRGRRCGGNEKRPRPGLRGAEGLGREEGPGGRARRQRGRGRGRGRGRSRGQGRGPVDVPVSPDAGRRGRPRRQGEKGRGGGPPRGSGRGVSADPAEREVAGSAAAGGSSVPGSNSGSSSGSNSGSNSGSVPGPDAAPPASSSSLLLLNPLAHAQRPEGAGKAQAGVGLDLGAAL